jgi:N-6 DNA Methylase
MPKDPELIAHQEWLGYLQPVGLVVSPPALAAAGAFPNKNIIPDHARFLECVEEIILEGESDSRPAIRDFARFATHVLGWEPADLMGTTEGGQIPESLEVNLTEYNETLRPTYAVREFCNTPGAEAKWLLLFQKVKSGISLDDAAETPDHRWQASPEARFERLLRGTQVPIGLLSNGVSLRLVYAPHGETSGHLTFPVQAMTEVAGRPIFAALQMLLSAEQLFTLPDKQRLPHILAESRKYQNLVSTKLAEQVLAALYELLRGFQAADDQRHGDLLRDVLKDDPNQVYAGLLRVLMRLVFILYAEDRSLLSNDEIYQKFYSVIGLFERLRADAGRHTDTMDNRYGAWTQLLTLFRLIYDGGRHGGLRLLPRKGYLFDPDRYPFLEGRTRGSKRQPGELVEPPRVSDGVVFRVLQNLLILDGERLSYRTLDVEQIGSVYETMMGFNLEVAKGRSIAIKPTKPHGAPTTINLDDILAAKPADRAKWLKEKSDQAVTGQAATALKDAKTPEDAVAALEKKVARAATPNIVPPGAMVLQPSDERRKSGSHYTPRSLTEPIVRTTLRPILERLGPNRTPAEILDLKVCDPAMGSGAFLVEACRQLGDELVRAWHTHNSVPTIPPDEDEVLHARRLIAQRCLYGVDKNPMAVDLAKLSLWLATLAKDHPFTFLDHALRCGDSLVGLSREQIEGFHWKPEKQRDFARGVIERKIREAMKGRLRIQNASDFEPYLKLDQELALVEEALDRPRFYGDLVASAFFGGANDRKRKDRLDELTETLAAHLANPDFLKFYPALESARNALRSGEKPVTPFHWPIEFPEVFARENPGFDAIVGNPPFMGGTIISNSLGMAYFDWLTNAHPPAGHLCDLVGYFFRRAFDLMRDGATLGFVATNTIAQGDTREGGLGEIGRRGGVIYDATKRFRWPGSAAVVVSLVHIAKRFSLSARLDGKAVERISSFLFARGGDESPSTLNGRGELWSLGTKIYGAGFLFEDGAQGSTPLDKMREILACHPGYSEVIRPYIGGDELNTHPRHEHSRFVINLNDVPEEPGLDAWPELRQIIYEMVKPTRDALGPNPNNAPLKKRWWAFQGHRPEFYRAARQLRRVLAQSQVSAHLGFAFQPTDRIFANTLNLFLFDSYSAFAVLQSRPHEMWVRCFASSLEDRLRYTPSDCFENFPFPSTFESDQVLEQAGQAYYDFRADSMVRNNEGLTKTYNRFHNPDESSPDALKLRELHAAMDRAVLDAYAWNDLNPSCEFLLEYEEDEDEVEAGGGSHHRKRPWRYRWPDDFRDEVLARLLELNRQVAAREQLAGGEKRTGQKNKKRNVRRQSPPTESGDSFVMKMF